MKIISLNKVGSQSLGFSNDDQSYRIEIIDRGWTGVNFSIFQQGIPILLNILCLDRTKIIQQSYPLIDGDFMFVDQVGTDNPSYFGFGDRFLLYYLNQDELNIGN